MAILRDVFVKSNVQLAELETLWLNYAIVVRLEQNTPMPVFGDDITKGQKVIIDVRSSVIRIDRLDCILKKAHVVKVLDME